MTFGDKQFIPWSLGEEEVSFARLKLWREESYTFPRVAA